MPASCTTEGCKVVPRENNTVCYHHRVAAVQQLCITCGKATRVAGGQCRAVTCGGWATYKAEYKRRKAIIKAREAAKKPIEMPKPAKYEMPVEVTELLNEMPGEELKILNYEMMAADFRATGKTLREAQARLDCISISLAREWHRSSHIWKKIRYLLEVKDPEAVAERLLRVHE